MAMTSSQSPSAMQKPKAKNSMEKFTFTVGKLDAGMAILLGPNAHLIEFPSLLLPPNLTTGSIVTITVSRDHIAEQKSQSAFTALQTSILAQFGQASPKPPVLKIRNVTQTSVTLDWEQLELAQASVRGLEVFRNGVRFANVWKGRGKAGYGVDVKDREWKGSSLQSGEEYTFQLVLKTTAGTYSSNLVRIRTHGMNDTSGILVCFGTIQPPSLLADAKAALEKMGARYAPQVEIDTTHFVCTTPAPAIDGAAGRNGLASGATKEYERAITLSLPIVQPSWVFACAGEKKLMPISNYTLSSTSSSTAAAQAPPFKRVPSPLPLKRSSLPFTSSAPPSPGGLAEAGEEIRRSPSPETIARMAMHVPGPASAPLVDREAKRRDSIPIPRDSQPARPKSPIRAEADGRLDRGFKFPVSTPPNQSPTQASGPGTEAGAGPSADSARAASELVKEETARAEKASVILPGAVAGDAEAGEAEEKVNGADQKAGPAASDLPESEKADQASTNAAAAAAEDETEKPPAAQPEVAAAPEQPTAPSSDSADAEAASTPTSAAISVPEIQISDADDSQAPVEISASEERVEEPVTPAVDAPRDGELVVQAAQESDKVDETPSEVIETSTSTSQPGSGAVSDAGEPADAKQSKNAKKKAKAKAKKQGAEIAALEEVDLS